MVPESQNSHRAPRLDCEIALPSEIATQPVFRGNKIILFSVTIQDCGLNALWNKCRKIVIAIAKVLGLVGTIVSLAYFGLRNDQLARWTAMKEFYALCNSDPVPNGLDCSFVEGKSLSPPPYLNSSTMFLGRRETLLRDDLDGRVPKMASFGVLSDFYVCSPWVLSCIILLGVGLIVAHDWLSQQHKSQMAKDDESNASNFRRPGEALHGGAVYTQYQQFDDAHPRHRIVKSSPGPRVGNSTPTEPLNNLPPASIADFIRRCFAEDICLADSGQVLTALEGFRTLHSHVKERVHSAITAQNQGSPTDVTRQLSTRQLSSSWDRTENSYLEAQDTLKLWVDRHSPSMGHEKREEMLKQLATCSGQVHVTSVTNRTFFFQLFCAEGPDRELVGYPRLNQVPQATWKWSDIRASINRYIDAAEDLVQECATIVG